MHIFYRFRFLGGFVVLAALAAFGAVVMLLWNALMPDIFGLPALTYWQATGLLALAKILFGGFVPRGGHPHGWHDERLFRHDNKLREKWMAMSDEERKEFIKKEKEFMRFHGRLSPFHHCFGDDDDRAAGKTGDDEGRNNE